MLTKRYSEIEVSEDAKFMMRIVMDKLEEREMTIKELGKKIRSEKIYDEKSFIKAIDLLKRKGDVYEQKKGVLVRI